METQVDVMAVYPRAIDQAATIIRGIRTEQLSASTPCPKWSVKELLDHLIGSNLMMAAVGSGQSMGEEMSGTDAVAALGDVTGDDPQAAYAHASSNARAAFEASGAQERPWALPFATIPGAMANRIHFFETVIHTWDLARATNQEAKLDPALATSAESVARGIVGDQFRNDAGDPYAAEVTVAVGAPPYDRLAAFLGRRP
jgi:uncharacterized protein (TIGR03086 family)